MEQLADVLQRLAADFVASEVQTTQVFQLGNARHSVISDLVVVDEELSKLSETVAYREQSEVCDLVFPQNQSFDSVEVLEADDVFVVDFCVGEVDFFGL